MEKKKIILPTKEKHPDCRSCTFYQFCDAEKKCELYFSLDGDLKKEEKIVKKGELF